MQTFDNERYSKDKTGSVGKRGLTVIVYNNNVNKAISQLKKRCASEGITKELRRRKNFETNTSKRRRDLAEAKSRWRKKQAQQLGIENGKYPR
jgi:ribosomal protein S21